MRTSTYITLGGILIIAYLLLAPVSTFCGLSAEAAMAKNDAVNLSNSLVVFKVEYGSYPEGSIREILNQVSGENPKKIVFIELEPRKMSSDGIFLDPWRHPYQINLVDDPKTPHVWSLGKNGIDDSTNAKSDDLRSWE